MSGVCFLIAGRGVNTRLSVGCIHTRDAVEEVKFVVEANGSESQFSSPTDGLE